MKRVVMVTLAAVLVGGCAEFKAGQVVEVPKPRPIEDPCPLDSTSERKSSMCDYLLKRDTRRRQAEQELKARQAAEEATIAEEVKGAGLQPLPIGPGESDEERFARHQQEKKRIREAEVARRRAEADAAAKQELEQAAEEEAQEKAKKKRCGALYHAIPKPSTNYKKWEACAEDTYYLKGQIQREGVTVDVHISYGGGVVVFVKGGKVVGWEQR